MSEDLKQAIDCLIEKEEWRALDAIVRVFGNEVYDYIRNHPDCPW